MTIISKNVRWYLNRKVEFFPFDTSIVNEGYVRGKNNAFKWRFKNTMFYYRDGFEYSLRGIKDLEELKLVLEKKFNNVFVTKIGKAIYNSGKNLLETTKETFQDKQSFSKNFDNFCTSYASYLSIFQTPELAQKLIPEKSRKLLRQFGLFRDYSTRTFMAKAENIYRPRLGKILGLPYVQALSLLPKEIKNYLQNGKLPKNFKNRKSATIITLNGKTKVYWNRKADKIFYNEYERYMENFSQKKKLLGQSAYKGKITGKAYLALNRKDFEKIPPKAILICSNTRYTIVPYLSKVSAIVTDEGGITCHAAIMARELKIPTITGTKDATEVFFTGDTIEVDANKGVVRKLK